MLRSLAELSPIKLESILLRTLKALGFKSHTVRIHGSGVHYLIKQGRPDLPPVVFVHGIAANAVQWIKVLPKIAAAGHTVFAVDLPGHGFSEDPSRPLKYENLITSLSIFLKTVVKEKAYLVGNSLGGAVSLGVAIAAPENLIGAVLISPPGPFNDEDEWRTFEKGLRIRNFRGAMSLLPKLYNSSPWYLPLLAPSVMRNFNRRPIGEILDSITPEFTQRSMTHIQVPLLFIWGTGEKLLPKVQLERYKERLPRTVVYEEPEGIGHCPQLDRADWLAPRLMAYFSGDGDRCQPVPSGSS